MTRRINPTWLAPMMALCLFSASASAQTAPAMSPSASMPMGNMPMQKGGMPMQQGGMPMQKGSMPMQPASAGSNDMMAAMMKGMDGMQKMPMSGDTDKDFAMMMKMHHQQAVNMSEMELAKGKSREMKAMAKKIIAAQKKEIAQLDQWLAKQK